MSKKVTNKMKIIAFYLPQFHSIRENDRWWGKGFTEWTNVKKAKPLFKGHYQPRKPFNNYYYNLLDQETREWQANLAKKYGIYGFCYYHYWFNGKKLLEKPLEEVLRLKKPNFPFCMSWANEPWTRTWDGGENRILMPQEYGEKKEWREHFIYLMQFFKDKRYIKINNKPLFLIYRAHSIKKIDEMIIYWDKLAKKNGLKGIYIAETMTGFNNKSFSKKSKAIVEFEPMYSLHNYTGDYFKISNKFKLIFNNILSNLNISKRFFNIVNYDFVWDKIIRRQKKYKGKQVFLGAFVDWDNSPRKGDKALIIKGSTPEKFKKYLSFQIKKSKEIYNSEILFINAWNEWAEGAHLEPDKKRGIKYLEMIKNILDNIESY